MGTVYTLSNDNNASVYNCAYENKDDALDAAITLDELEENVGKSVLVYEAELEDLPSFVEVQKSSADSNW